MPAGQRATQFLYMQKRIGRSMEVAHVTFHARTEHRSEGITIHALENPETGDRAEVWAERGFNCFRWTVRGVEVLYADPQFLAGGSPTRTGIPILFPFPNRIRAGRFTWQGKEYHLPANDPAKANAIHGFACRRAWRVTGQGADASSAWITGEFQGSRDAADCRHLWPGDYRIAVTYRLLDGRLRIEARVDNPDADVLPFGLGYHPYFRVDAATMVQVPANGFWELTECLPSGRILPGPADRDLNQPRRFADLQLDDVLTQLPHDPLPGAGPLCLRGKIQRRDGTLSMLAAPSFRETVVFTPPHRQAFCIEPYTCVTDAINLQSQGVDAGLLTLRPREEWTGVVEMRFAEGES
jgi:aldose 1-epimerase